MSAKGLNPDSLNHREGRQMEVAQVFPLEVYQFTIKPNTVELQWLEHLWNQDNMFQAGVVRTNDLMIAPGQEAL